MAASSTAAEAAGRSERIRGRVLVLKSAQSGIWPWVTELFRRFGWEIGWEEGLVMGLVILASLIAIAVYVVGRLKAGIKRPTTSLQEHLSDFRRMRDTGQIDDQEFSRVVNTVSQKEPEETPRFHPLPPVSSEKPTPPEASP